jgi:hypothetical protein
MEYNYILESNKVINRFKSGKLTKEQAFNELEKIEDKAYEIYPDAEPDGDITYMVATACEEIEAWDSRDEEDKAYGIHPNVRKDTDIIAKYHDEMMETRDRNKKNGR